MSTTNNTSPQDNDQAYYRRDMHGKIFQAVVSSLLASAGYTVAAYGHEDVHPLLCLYFTQQGTQQFARDAVTQRHRSAPDLFVLTPEKKSREPRTRLVEVKYRSEHVPGKIRLYNLDVYKQFWPETVLMVVVPFGSIFYAQRVLTLPAKQSVFTLDTDFLPVSRVFTAVSPENLSYYQQVARNLHLAITGEVAVPGKQVREWALPG